MGKRFSVMRLCGLRRGAAQPMIAKQQYHRLMKECQSTENVTASAMKADISRPTARKYLEAQQPPDRLQVKHTWRTRPDPLAAIWPQVEARLRQARNWKPRRCWSILRGGNRGTCPSGIYARCSGGWPNGDCKTGRTRKCFSRRTGWPARRCNWISKVRPATTRCDLGRGDGLMD